MAVQEGTVLGFDFGTKHIGVAVGETLARSARAIETVTARANIPDWDHIDRIIAAYRPILMVVGHPLNMDGSRQDTTARAEAFERALGKRYQIATARIDERLSSVEAKERMRDTSTRKQSIHAYAAQVILQTWLDQSN
jgi:putative Holliday junction resolvase